MGVPLPLIYNGWKFTQKATEIVKEYITKLLQRFMVITGNQREDLYSDKDFCDPWERTATVNEIQDRSKSILSTDFKKVPLEAK